MEITQKVAATTAASIGQSQSAELGTEFNSFIRLLTAQVRNQDPLAPLDSTQFVEQLATFSSLEQQVTSNRSLDSIASILSEIHSLSASEWIGQEVAIPVEWAPWQSSDMSFQLPAGQSGTGGVFTVQDQTGKTVFSTDLAPGQTSASWAGEFSDGGTATAGDIYRFQYSQQTANGTQVYDPRLVTTVSQLDISSGEVRLVTTAGLSVRTSDATRT